MMSLQLPVTWCLQLPAAIATCTPSHITVRSELPITSITTNHGTHSQLPFGFARGLQTSRAVRSRCQPQRTTGSAKSSLGSRAARYHCIRRSLHATSVLLPFSTA